MKTEVIFAIAIAGLTATPAFAAADLKKGEDIYLDRCSLCHPADGVGQGPNLKGVVGRKAASSSDFSYTDALKRSNLTWTPETLSKFLAEPMKIVPGTAMPIAVSDPSERADLIAYLTSQK